MIETTSKTYKGHDVLIFRDALTSLGFFNIEVTCGAEHLSGQVVGKSPTNVFKRIKGRIDDGSIFSLKKNPAAQALRAIPSKRRSETSRANGKKGGRPKKTTD